MWIGRLGLSRASLIVVEFRLARINYHADVVIVVAEGRGELEETEARLLLYLLGLQEPRERVVQHFPQTMCTESILEGMYTALRDCVYGAWKG